MKNLVLLAAAVFCFAGSFAQSVGVNTLTPHAKSVLDVVSPDKGVLLPRLTSAARLSMFPSSDTTARGMLVYQKDDTTGFYYYDGYAWLFISSGYTFSNAAQWVSTGSNIFNANRSNVGINNPAPAERLDVRGNVNISTDSSYKMGGYAVVRSSNDGYNFFAGREAGKNANGGSSNLCAGSFSGYSNTGSYNSFVGQTSGYNNTSGSYNTFLGSYSGHGNTTGSGNVILGYAAGQAITYTGNNTLVGYRAGMNAQTSSENVAIGKEAGFNLLGGFNTVVGNNAAYSNTNGIENTALGYSAAYNNQNGNQNTSIGFQAGMSLTSGNGNTLLGYKAGTGASSLQHSTLVGENASAASNVKYGTAIGTGAYVKKDSSVSIGDSADHIGVGIKESAPKRGSLDVNARVIYQPETYIQGVNHPEVFFNWNGLKYVKIDAKTKTYFKIKVNAELRTLMLLRPVVGPGDPTPLGTADPGQIVIVQNDISSLQVIHVVSQHVAGYGAPMPGLYSRDPSSFDLYPGDTVSFIFDGELWRKL